MYTAIKSPNLDLSKIDSAGFIRNTIPYFSRSVISPLNGKTYTSRVVGSDPATSNTTTDVVYVPIVVVWKFPDGTVLDPRNPACNDNVSVENRFFKGPSFNPVMVMSNGIQVGPAQLNDADQRAEFWSEVSTNTSYHTNLVTFSPPVVLVESAPSGSRTFGGVCSGAGHRIGTIDINAFDNIIIGIANAYSSPTEVPMMLTYNVFQTVGGGCCVIGFHQAYSRPTGTQTLAIGAYNDPGIFNVPIEDIHAWNHEIGELFNDPFVSNFVPAWGHVGQVGGCQDNLEVGDPLTGTPFIVVRNGFTYHPQELAFYDWFYRTASEGTGGLYSFRGSFTGVQGKCTP